MGLLAGNAQATPVVYGGKMGTTPVVIELDVKLDGRVKSRYFVTPERVTHYINGQRSKQGVVTLDGESYTSYSDSEYGTEDEEKTASSPVITLRATENGWQGEWRQGQDKPLAIELSPVAPIATTGLSPFMQSLYQFSPYDYLLHATAEPVMVKQGVVKGYNVEWWQEPNAKLSMFQLTSGYPAERLADLNAALRESFWRSLLDVVQCEHSDDTVKISLLSEKMISYVISSVLECGGAHSYMKVSPHILRVSDASELTLSDLMWVDESPVPDASAIPDDYLQETLPTWLAAQFARLYPEQTAATDDESADACDYSSSEVWANAPWSLTSKGIYFQTMTPNLTSQCKGSGWEILPWDIVKQHPGRLKDLLGVVTNTTDAEPQLFSGTLGNRPIVLELNITADNNVAGRYFYTRYRRDRQLLGERRADGQLVLTEEVSGAYRDTDVDFPTLTLHPISGQGWQGEWRTSTGKTAVITLLPLTVATPAAPASAFMQSLYSRSRYDYVRNQGAEPQSVKKEVINGYEVEWWQDPLSGMQTAQLVSGYTPEQRARLNAKLIDSLWEQATLIQRCEMTSNGKGYISIAMSLRLLSPSVVSYTIDVGRMCDYFRVDIYTIASTLRSRDAKPLALEDILWVADSPIPDNRTESAGRYPDGNFTDWLVEQFKVRYPKQTNDKYQVDGKTCSYGDPESWGEPEWYLTPQGIHFLPTFISVSTPECHDADWAVLPWKSVKQHPGRLKDLPLP
ncbi:hypothetical protein LF934_08470 [Dickeya dadantii]|uniref:hypothetical protein n=1 Tax=Dickeya dadantii TaxID=204038 RepID=UPI001CF1C260|nr:hypothetical protein [Dickeya dadantii]MCA7012680.1 hypothetical protein [Dickeya dadantii]